MYLIDIFEAADNEKLVQAIKSFESHLHTLDVEGDRAADVLNAVFSQVVNQLRLDDDTKIALADWLKSEHNLANLREEIVPLRSTETQRYDDAVDKQKGRHTEYRPESGPKGTSGLGSNVVDSELLPIVTAGQIPEEYDSIEDWLWDFWPEMDWHDPRDDIKEIMNHPKYNEIVTFFREVYNFNFDKELKDAFYEYKDRDLGLPAIEETTSAGSVATSVSALGAGDPKASIYYNQKKKKKKKTYESKYARMNQLAEQIAEMEAQLIKNNAPAQKLTETEAEAVYLVKELIENLDYDPDDAMKEAEGLLLHEGHDVEGLDWCSVADHILILN